ncbi:hypothetical protein ACB092_06G274500 [Castanea dentata]
MALITTKGASYFSSSSSSSFAHQSKYFNQFDVFLSFRGEDTRSNFVSHLYHALCFRGIHTFIDNNLERGKEISIELFKTIENSKMSIIVFSEDYASSSWCLDELTKIIECRKNNQLVLPIFYKLDPSEVRKQQGKFGEALTRHEERFKDKKKVQRWRKALCEAGKISGWDYKNSHNEYDLIQEIVEEVSKSKLNQMELYVAKYPVGIKSRVEDLITYLNIESNEDVYMVAICGIGGVGKTTIAKATYNKILHHFKAKVFLENVRERSKTIEGIICLQKILLSKILGDRNLEVCNVSSGIAMINERLCGKRVLIILDDVDNLDQIENLLGKCDQFAPGSRIIMTTRNKRLLVTLGNGISTYIYEVKELNEYEAIELFNMHAFGSNEPNGDYLELVHEVIHYAKGLPLALIVMGADLCGRSKLEWENSIKKYDKIPNGDIQKILKISYERLDENEKNIFLDIACFFKGYCMDYDKVVDILEKCDLEPVDGIARLIDKCLVTINYGNKLSMHDLLQRMGREIVRQESPQNPGERSRLWRCEDVLNVLTENMGSNKVQSIMLYSRKPKKLHLKAQMFRKMKNLRLLTIRNVHCCGQLEYLPNGLRLLDWRKYPLPSLPSHFSPKNLVVLNMVFAFKSMSYVDFSRCESIRKIPDLSMSPNIKELKLSYCKNLVEIDDSVGRLDKLEVWNLSRCDKLETLPSCLTMKSLRFFNLLFCKSLKKFPNVSREMKSLEELHLYGTGISELPPSFGNLTGMIELILGNSEAGHLHIPGSIYNLQRLQHLFLFGDFTFLKDVELLRNSYGGFSKYAFPSLNLISLTAVPNPSEMDFILNYCCPPSLECLWIHDSKIVTFPKITGRLRSLELVNIKLCNELGEIPSLPQIPHPNSSSTISPAFVPSPYYSFPEYHCMFDGYGDEIPNWFNHQSNENSISFLIGPEFPTIALCFAIEITPTETVKARSCNFVYYVFISINGGDRLFSMVQVSSCVNSTIPSSQLEVPFINHY